LEFARHRSERTKASIEQTYTELEYIVSNASIYHSIIIRAALLTFALLAAPIVRADVVIDVDTADDLIDDNTGDGRCHTVADSCSLRAAIMQANHLSVPGVRINVPAGTYTLSLPPSGSDGEDNGDLNITAPGSRPGRNRGITINGAGIGSTIIDANQIDRVLTVNARGRATITGVTIRGGHHQTTTPNDDSGGGIQNLGTLAIAGSAIESNLADWGGGVCNEGTLTIAESVIGNNRAGISGGGILASERALTTITGSVLENNRAGTWGGGVTSGGVLNVVRSTIRSNLAESGEGGGMWVSGAATVRDSTLSSNSALTGGGILSSGSSLDTNFLYVVDSTISSNTANDDGGGIGAFYKTTIALFNTTIVSNDADHDRDEWYGGNGGGVYIHPSYRFPYEPSSRFVAVNSLIASNTQRDAPIDDDCFGTVELYGFNLFGEVSACAFSGNGDSAWRLILPDTLGALQDNGGPTLTHALLPGSNAIDTTYDQGCIDETGAQLTTDQRGAPRVFGQRCDVGAFEYGALVDH
jgi:hypothetical protein